jgi:hypothetical protein
MGHPNFIYIREAQCSTHIHGRIFMRKIFPQCVNLTIYVTAWLLEGRKIHFLKYHLRKILGKKIGNTEK